MRRFFIGSLFVPVLFVLLTSSTAHAQTFTLAWDPPDDVSNVAGYVISYGTASGVYTQQLNVGLVTRTRVSNLAYSTTYYFTVQSYNSNGVVSERSNEIWGTTPAAPKQSTPPKGGGGGGTPPPPTTPLVATMNGNLLEIVWQAQNAATHYRVEVGTAPGKTSYSAVTDLTALSFDTRLLPSSLYYVRVRGIFNGSPGAASPEQTVSATPGMLGATLDAASGQCQPGAPYKFVASADGTAAQLFWQPSTGPVSAFVLEVGSSPGLADVLVWPIPPNHNALGAQAAPARYALRLVTVNDCGPSVWGAEWLLDVGKTPALPTAPRALAQQVTGNLVTLLWAAPAEGGAVTRYLIEAQTAVGPVAFDTGNPTSLFLHPNTPPGQYVVTVRAGNASGFGPPSNAVTVVVP